MTMAKIKIGTDYFRKFREEGNYYVDKTTWKGAAFSESRFSINS